jgi:hypothetical protein
VRTTPSSLVAPKSDKGGSALMLDEKGKRLAKRHDALSLRTLRERGETPESLRRDWKAD